MVGGLVGGCYVFCSGYEWWVWQGLYVSSLSLFVILVVFFMVMVMDSKWWWCAVGMVANVVEVFFFFLLWGLILGWVLTMVVVVGFDCCIGGDWLLGFDCCAGGGCCEELVFVAEFWWKVGCMGLLERERQRGRERKER